ARNRCRPRPCRAPTDHRPWSRASTAPRPSSSPSSRRAKVEVTRVPPHLQAVISIQKVIVPDLSLFPITERWPAQHPDHIQLYSLNTPNGVKVSIMLEETGLAYEP